MRTRRLTAVLLAACALSGCTKEPPARPGDMLPRPRDTDKTPTSRPAGTGPKGHVIAAGVLQVYKRFISIEDAMTMGQLVFEDLDGTLALEEFRDRASPIVDKVIMWLVTATLALTEAEGEMTASQKAAIDAGIKRATDDMISNAGGTMEQLREDLAKRGLVLERVIERERRDRTIDQYFRRKYLPAIVITKRMIRKYYQDNKARKYKTERMVHLRVIVVPIAALLPREEKAPAAAASAEQLAAAREEAGKIVHRAAERINKGADFGQVAKDVGNDIRKRFAKEWDQADFRGKGRVERMIAKGGLWGDDPVKPDDLTDEVLTAAAKELEQDDIRKVEEGDDYCYLIQAYRVRSAQDVSFEEARDKIERLLRGNEFNLRKAVHMRKREAEFLSLQTKEEWESAAASFKKMVLDRLAADYWQGPAAASGASPASR